VYKQFQLNIWWRETWSFHQNHVHYLDKYQYHFLYKGKRFQVLRLRGYTVCRIGVRLMSVVVFWVVTPCGLAGEYQRSFKSLVTIYKATRCPILEDHNWQLHRPKNLKFQTLWHCLQKFNWERRQIYVNWIQLTKSTSSRTRIFLSPLLDVLHFASWPVCFSLISLLFDKTLRRMFIRMKENVSGDWRRLQNLMISTFHQILFRVIKSCRKKISVCEIINVCTQFGKPKGNSWKT
jgi:hypothetical protein